MLKGANDSKYPKIFEFLYWVIIDIYRALKNGKQFDLYGVTVFCGKQGSGKTISIIEYLERVRKQYPNALIGTNFKYVNQDFEFNDWKQLMEVRNDKDGVVFVVDEIQNEYDSNKWADFPDSLLSQVTMQRKQKIKIVLSSQVFKRMVIQLREQCYEVVECRTFMKRWTFCRAFDAYEYEAAYSQPDKKMYLHRSWRYSFVQSDKLRELYDTDEIVQRMAKLDYIPREKRSNRGA